MKTKLLFCFIVACFSFFLALSAQQKIKVSILGDSYSTFYGYVTPETNRCWYGVPEEKKENDVKRVEETWWTLFYVVTVGNWNVTILIQALPFVIQAMGK
jgi:hypothetical protein